MLERCFYVLMIKFIKTSQEIKWAKEKVTVLKIHQFWCLKSRVEIWAKGGELGALFVDLSKAIFQLEKKNVKSVHHDLAKMLKSLVL